MLFVHLQRNIKLSFLLACVLDTKFFSQQDVGNKFNNKHKYKNKAVKIATKNIKKDIAISEDFVMNFKVNS